MEEIDEALWRTEERKAEWNQYVDEVINRADDRFKVLPSRYGLGLFAQRDIQPGETLRYPGKRMTDEEIEQLDQKKYDKNAGNIVGSIYPRNDPNLASFANDPGHFEWGETATADRHIFGKLRKFYRKNDALTNAFLQSDDEEGVILVISKPIKKDKEVLITYGTQYWSERPGRTIVVRHGRRQRRRV